VSTISVELQSIERETADVRRESDDVADQIAGLERQRSLNPVQRGQLSRLRQQSEDLADRLAFLDARATRVHTAYASSADQLIALLDPEIDSARQALQAAVPGSPEREARFRDFESLVQERRTLRVRFRPTPRYLRLDVRIDADDTPDSLAIKADLLADNKDLIAVILGRLSAWKRELTETKFLLEEVARMEEERRVFEAPNPLERVRPDPGLGLSQEVEVPPDLQDLESRMILPPEGIRDIEDYERLIASIERLEVELEDDVLGMEEMRKLVLEEAARREGTE